MVTVFCPLMTIGAGRLVVQVEGEPRFVVDCRVKPVKLVCHDRITSGPARLIVSDGDGGNERLNTVPTPKAPPPIVVP